jgi:hypothetical protein
MTPAWQHSPMPARELKAGGPGDNDTMRDTAGPGASSSPADELTERVRAICLGFPGATERITHGSPGFFVGRQFVMLWPNGHHDHNFPHLWSAAPPGAQEELLRSASDRFFRPPYVGGRGWIGVRLDGAVDWAEVQELCEDAYLCIAPAKLVRLLQPPG